MHQGLRVPQVQRCHLAALYRNHRSQRPLFYDTSTLLALRMESEQKSNLGSVNYRRGGFGNACGQGGPHGQRGRDGACRDMAEITCYNCFQHSHMQHNCPKANENVPNENNQRCMSFGVKLLFLFFSF